MIKCKECSVEQYEGALFCSECGANLLEAASKSTAILPFADSEPSTPSALTLNDLKTVTKPQMFTFVIPNSGRRINVQTTRQIRAGRKDPIRGIEPELDLSLDGGAKFGVSRLHATIQLTDRGPVLIDLGSTNGTLLNNYRLPQEMPYLLRSGDEIRFGHLLVLLFFEV